ncbi:hypothetical protein QYF61_018424 [Mycteria americana]|uniref:SGNH hydrolase-type esterase domain-containing protein n=1 Tax=Mycteria americana TaxID=33587 RepID=A0AAN7NB69_MYCAM|nr:hypothetical protein QYF61_018424 [Mycteria americana]
MYKNLGSLCNKASYVNPRRKEEGAIPHSLHKIAHPTQDRHQCQGQAKQSQLSQPLLIRLLLQTLHQLRCPSLDTLQHLNVFPVLRGPKPNTVFEVQPHQCRVQGHNHFPTPAGHTIFDTSQDAIGFLGHLGTLLAHIQLAVNQQPQVLLCLAAFQPLFPKPMALHGVVVTQINTPTQLGVICKLAEGALNPLVQIIDKDIKQNWPQHRALGNTACDRPPTGVNSIHHHSLGPAIQPVFYPAKRDILDAVEALLSNSQNVSWGPSHGRQSSTTFSNMGPSHGVQFFTNCSSMGTFHGVQSFRKGLFRHGSSAGSQVLPENLLQRGSSPQGHRSCQEPAPARALHGVTASFRRIHLLQHGVLHGLQGDNLLHHGLHHGLQGNLCSGAWSTSSPSFFTDLVLGGDFGTNRRAQDINTWLQDRCLHQNFGFLNHGKVFETQGMLGPDGIHLSRWGKCVFGCKLAELIERALTRTYGGREYQQES